MSAGVVVGFDLDMTLIDSRPGIGATLRQLVVETGVPIDIDLVTSRLGPPLEDELAHWFPVADVPAVADRFRALYTAYAIRPTQPLPGARESLAAVRDAGGRAVVVTAKYAPNARLHLDHLELPYDTLHGWCWAAAKGTALLAEGASVYVGDHLGDILGARAAGAVAVAVASGPVSADELRAAGADVVLDDLTAFPAWFESYLLDLRLADLERRLRELGRVVVAFSGGADSAFLLAAAVRALGPANVTAATAISDSLAGSELAPARKFAAGLGVEHVSPTTAELAREGYRANAGDRCFFCKAELLDVLGPLAAARNAQVVTGTNADDVGAGFRPGIRAASERGAHIPLADAGLTKSQVRAASRRWGLATWDKPAAACLSSRIAYGITITPARLARVDRAEAALRAVLAELALPVIDVRVRDLGDVDLGGIARIEVDRAHVEAVTASARALDAVRRCGFGTVEVDPRGFRSGAMNELLADPARFR